MLKWTKLAGNYNRKNGKPGYVHVAGGYQLSEIANNSWYASLDNITFNRYDSLEAAKKGCEEHALQMITERLLR